MGLARWRAIHGWRDHEVAERVRRDGIDILVDLAGHTANNRLGVFAQRAAPVQISYLGYPDTTGLPTIDYRLTDAVADPDGADAGYAERLYRLPDGFLCYEPPADAPAVTARPGALRGTITFASFNNLAKVNDAVVDAWARILAGVPGSRLLLKNRALGDAGVRERCAGMFAARGIGPERLEMTGWTADQHSHLALYGEVDIALDTFPYNGTTTSCEALWMGVPVVTLAGDHHVGRVGRSLLGRIGLEALCAADPADYVDLAIRLAARPDKLDALRANLRPLMRVRLCDALAFTRTLEAAYRAIYDDCMARAGRHRLSEAVAADP